jgi:response regulator NasT
MTPEEHKLNVLVVDARPAELGVLEMSLVDAGHEIFALDAEDAGLAGAVAHHPIDVVVIGIESLDEATLLEIQTLSSTAPRPVVLFTDDPDPESIRAAIKAGVTAYVVDGLYVSRVASVIDAARFRFDLTQTLAAELKAAKQGFAQRKVIELAKGVLMGRNGIDEPAAHRQMLKMAIEKNKQLHDIATGVIFAAELLA